MSYGQDVHRRVGAAIGLAVVSLGVGALMALTKSKKHFIGVTWDDAGKKGGLAIQADKNQYRGVLAGLEGVTGKKAVNSDTLSVKNWNPAPHLPLPAGLSAGEICLREHTPQSHPNEGVWGDLRLAGR